MKLWWTCAIAVTLMRALGLLGALTLLLFWVWTTYVEDLTLLGWAVICWLVLHLGGNLLWQVWIEPWADRWRT